MPKYLDGVKIKAKKPAAESAVPGSQTAAPAEKPAPAAPDEPLLRLPEVPLGSPVEGLRNWRSKRTEERALRTAERRAAALLKQEEKSRREAERLERIERERKKRLERYWETAEASKQKELERLSRREQRRRAKEKLRAQRLANRLQRDGGSVAFSADALALPANLGGRVQTLLFLPWNIARTGAAGVWRRSKRGLRTLALSLLGLVVIYAVLGAAVVMLPETAPARFIARFVPVPALVVGWQPVSIRRYRFEERFDRWYGDGSATATAAPAMPGLYLPADTAERLRYKVALERLARRYGVTVSPEAVEDRYVAYAAAAGGEEAVRERVYNEYGLTLEFFKDNVLRYPALYAAVAEAYRRDDRAHASAVARLEHVLAQAQRGEEFEELARTYSEDEYALTGGDRGYWTVAELTPELQEAVSTLAAGEVSGIVRGDNAYAIVKLYDRTGTGEEARVWLKQISIVTNSDFDPYFVKQVERERVYLLLQE